MIYRHFAYRGRSTPPNVHIAHRTKDNKREHLILILAPSLLTPCPRRIMAHIVVPHSVLVGAIDVAATVSAL